MGAVLRIDVVSNAKGAISGFNQTESAAGKLGSTAKKLGGALAAGFAVDKIVDFGKAAFNAASDVQQSFGALDSVFGKQSAAVKSWANGAAQSVGLAKSQYAQLASLLGAQLTNMGRTQAQAATQTKGLITMGADLAATYGGSVADAVSALSSVLKGETDPIERYGISIKQSDINARIAAQGQDKLEGTAKKTATATAALALITQQAAAAHGQFGRETNTAAGQQERLHAQIENLQASIGAKLLPVATAAFGYLNSQAIPAAARLGAELQTRLGPAVSAVGRFVTGDLIPAARQIYEWYVTKIAPQLLKTVMPVLSAIGANFRSLSRTLDDNSSGLSKLARFLEGVIAVVAKLLPIVGKALALSLRTTAFEINVVVTVVAKLVDGIAAAIDKIRDFANAIKNSPLGKLAGGIGSVGGAIGGLFGASQATRGVVRLTRPADTGALVSPVTSAAAGATGWSSWVARTPGFGATLVDARTTVNLNVTGALDPASVARQIEGILRGHNVRLGRTAAFAPAG